MGFLGKKIYFGVERVEGKSKGSDLIFQDVRTKVASSGKSAGRIEINESGRLVKAAFKLMLLA